MSTIPLHDMTVQRDDLGQWSHQLARRQAELRRDDPSYYASNPESLITEVNTHAFILGTGEDIYAQLQSAIDTVCHELILITCFWAKSTSLTRLEQALRRLSDKSIQRGTRTKVFIGFSSLSLWQKLFQTSNLHGKLYSPSTWVETLGLPDPLELAGLDLTIKSIFVRPFSVMHPKFVIIDRRTVWLPSCNVSWESWLEGCVVVDGSIVKHFVEFWQMFWVRECQLDSSPRNSQLGDGQDSPTFVPNDFDDNTHIVRRLQHSDRSAVFLPSPHHLNPRFRPFPWQAAAPVPGTPLNTFLLTLFKTAKSHIYIQTPNLTCSAVLNSVLAALSRGVDVEILTSERLMILEQLVTAGRTTKGCVKKLLKRYQRMKGQHVDDDEEAQRTSVVGNLNIKFFSPKGIENSREPVQSHLKLTIVDRQWTIFGSGNMDRASWYTSQELGVAIDSVEIAESVRNMTATYLQHRHKTAQ